MPNYAENYASFKTSEDFEKFKKIAATDKCIFDFDKILPTPADLQGDELFDWHVENWGTKWSIDPLDVCIGTNSFSFLTAWSPAIEVYIAVVKADPTIAFNISYEEPGIGFCGDFVADGNGNWSYDISDYDFDDEYREMCDDPDFEYDYSLELAHRVFSNTEFHSGSVEGFDKKTIIAESYECPFCGSEQIYYDVIEIGEEAAYQDCTCEKCNATGIIEYREHDCEWRAA